MLLVEQLRMNRPMGWSLYIFVDRDRRKRPELKRGYWDLVRGFYEPC